MKNPRFNAFEHYRAAFLVEAVSIDEARGKAFRIAYKVYPSGDGFQAHAVDICPDTNVIDPDKPVSTTWRRSSET